MKRYASLLGGLLLRGSVLLVLAELAFRGVLLFDASLSERIATHRSWYAPTADLPTIRYSPHPYWVYNARPGQEGVNDWGFYFDDLPLEKAPGVTRVVCVGGSTTAGPWSWPFKLGEVLRERYPSRKVEVLNFGIGGWTSAESAVAFVMLGQSFEPDLVVVHQANNDIDPLTREGFRPDYSHFRRPIALSQDEMGNLQMRLGLSYALDRGLVQLSSIYVYLRLWRVGDMPTHYTLENLSKWPSTGQTSEGQNVGIFERNLVTIGTVAEAGGAQMVLTTIPHTTSEVPGWGDGLDRQNDRVLDVAERQGWASIALHDQDWDPAWWEDSIHLDEDGERAKGERIADRVGPMLFD